MRVFSFSEARQRLAALLNQARRDGQVQIRRRDGQVFLVTPAAPAGSPLDVPGVNANLRPGELETVIRESRDSARRYLTPTRSGRPAKPVRRRKRDT